MLSKKARTGEMRKRLNCIHINLQHSRLAKDNLRKKRRKRGQGYFIYTGNIYDRKQNCGFTTILQSLRFEGRKKRAAIFINNKQLVTILIKQLSEEDAVVLEIKVDNVRIIIANMYFDINRPKDIDTQNIDATLPLVKGV